MVVKFPFPRGGGWGVGRRGEWVTNFQKSTSNFSDLNPKVKFPFGGEGEGGMDG